MTLLILLYHSIVSGIDTNMQAAVPPIRLIKDIRIPGVHEVISDSKGGRFFALAQRNGQKLLCDCNVAGEVRSIKFSAGKYWPAGTDSSGVLVLEPISARILATSTEKQTLSYSDFSYKTLCIKSGYTIGTTPDGRVYTNWNTAWNSGTDLDVFGEHNQTISLSPGEGRPFMADISPSGKFAAVLYSSDYRTLVSFELNPKAPSRKSIRLEMPKPKAYLLGALKEMAMVNDTTVILLLDRSVPQKLTKPAEFRDYVYSGEPYDYELCTVSLRDGIVRDLEAAQFIPGYPHNMAVLDSKGTFAVVGEKGVVHIYKLAGNF